MLWTALALAMLPAPSPIEGSWKTGCVPIGQNGRHGLITRLTVEGSRLTVRSQLYAHDGCDRPTILTEYQGHLARVQPASGGVELDHAVRNVTMRIDAADVLPFYNSGEAGAGCGLTAWELGVSRSVAGRTCTPFVLPAEDAMLYERAWIEGNTMRLGSLPMAWTNSTPEKRAAAPAPLVFERVSQ